jgi:hypothetical protein
VEESHRSGVAQHVGADPLAVQGGAAAGGSRRVEGQAPFDRVARQRGAAAGAEQRLLAVSGPLVQPGFEDLEGVAGERGDALLASFAVAGDVCAGAQVKVCAAKPDEFGDAQTGLDRDRDQGVVSSSGPGGGVGRGEQRGGLWIGEVVDQGPLEPFGWDRQDAFDERGVFGVSQGSEPEQLADRSESGVSGRDAVAALVLEVVEERPDRLGVEIGDVELGWLLAGLLGDEHEQELERVTVGGDRVGAGLTLPDQPIGEERLQRWSKCTHRPSSR